MILTALSIITGLIVAYSHQTAKVADATHPLSEHSTVSIIIPAYSEEEYIETALSSIANQNVVLANPDSFEIITVVDERCTDRTAEIAQQYGKVVYAEAGKLTAKNVGAEHAAGDILVFIDADVDLKPNFLNLMLRHFNDPEVVAVGGVLMQGGLLQQIGCVYFNMYWLPLTKTLVGNSTAVRKNAFQAVGGYNLGIDQFNRREINIAEEVEFSRKLSQLGKVVIDTEASVSLARLINVQCSDCSIQNCPLCVQRAVGARF